MYLLKAVLVFCLLIILHSCFKNPEEKPKETPQQNLNKSLWICNEGNFQWGNASLSVYATDSSRVFNEVYQQVNGVDLGDVLQSSTVWKDEVWLIVNNSGKVVAVDKNSYQEKKVLRDMGSPRYLCALNDTFALVSDIYSNSLSVISPKTAQKKESYSTGTWTEEMGKVGDSSVFIQCPFQTYYYVFDVKKKELIKKEINDSIIDVLETRSKVFVLGEKALYEFMNEELIQLALNEKKVKRITNWIGDGLLGAKQSGDKVLLYSLKDKNNWEEFGALDCQQFYGFNSFPEKGEVYVMDAKDYVSKGELIVFDPQTKKEKRLKVGIIPGESILVE